MAVSGSLVTTTMSLEGSVHITCPHCQCSFKVPPLDRVMTAQSWCSPSVTLAGGTAGDEAPSQPAMKQSRRDEDPPPPPGPPPAVVLQPPVPVSTGGDEQNPWESVPSVALQPPVPVSSGAESSTPCTGPAADYVGYCRMTMSGTAADYVGYFKNPDAMFECETCNRAFAEEFFCWQHVLSREQCHQQPRTAAAVQAWVSGTVGHGWTSMKSKKK